MSGDFILIPLIIVCLVSLAIGVGLVWTALKPEKKDERPPRS